MTLMLSQGTRAPSWKLKDHNGKWQKSGDYLGKWMLVYFYPKDFTPGCTIEACGLRDNFEELRSKVVVLGVSKDSVASHAKFVQKYQLPFDLLSDTDGEVAKSFGSLGEKVLFGKKVSGVKRKSFLIDPDGIVQKVYDSVNPSRHAQEILDDWLKLNPRG